MRAYNGQESSETVSFDLKGPEGTSTKVHVRPSYPHKPKAVSNLLAALPELLTDAAMPVGGVKSFATTGWDLDESGDTIHRFAEFGSEDTVNRVLELVAQASQKLNHDPHIHVDGPRIVISCTTHVPPGLSMKDIKLARQINEILGNAGSQIIKQEDEAEILTQRQRAREHNMSAIRKAKASCSCG